MMKRAFITGITGQDGAYLAKLLLEKGYEVHGGVRRIGVAGNGRLRELDIADDVILHDFDLSELTNIMAVLDEVAPNEVYNLAAQSFVGVSFKQPLYTSDIDAIGVTRILDSLRILCGATPQKIRFYQASTSEMFGLVKSTPQNEETPFHPRSPYGVAKLYAHWMSVNYREAYDMFTCSGILFNHESPLRGAEFVTRKITLALARIKHGLQDVLSLGNLDARRDWGFAGDYVKGMWKMMQADTPDDYVLATGETHSIREFVEVAANACDYDIEWQGKGKQETGVDKKTGKTLITINPHFFRPAEVDFLMGDATKSQKVLGWCHEVDFEALAHMMVEADLKRVKDDRFSF